LEKIISVEAFRDVGGRRHTLHNCHPQR